MTRMMNDLRAEITSARHALSLSPSAFSQLAADEAQAKFATVEQQFVSRRSVRWWWAYFRFPSYRVLFEDGKGYARLTEIVPPSEKELLFFVGVDEVTANELPLIYKGEISAIQKVIEECFAFEYYVVAEENKWLICENHHGVLMAVGQPVQESLMRYVETHPTEIFKAYLFSS